MKALFVRRLVPPPACHGTYGCPDLWELADGDFAVIGEDITALAAQLPPGAGCAPTERMVRHHLQLQKDLKLLTELMNWVKYVSLIFLN